MHRSALQIRMLTLALLAGFGANALATPDMKTSTFDRLAPRQLETTILTIEKVEESAQNLVRAAHIAGLTMAVANGDRVGHAPAVSPKPDGVRFDQAAITFAASLTKVVFAYLIADFGNEQADSGEFDYQYEPSVECVCLTA